MRVRKRWLAIAAAACAILCALAAIPAAPAWGEESEPSATSAVGQTSDGSSTAAATLEINSLGELEGKTIGGLNGTVVYELVRDNTGLDLDFAYFNNVADMVAALKAGKIDAFVADEPVAELVVNQNEGVGILPEIVTDDKYGFFFTKGSPLTAQFSEVIDSMRADGTLAALKKKWTGADMEAKTLPEQDWATPNGRLTFATSGLVEPISYFQNGEITGYDVELALLVCKELGYGCDIITQDFAAMLAAVPAGKADFGGSGTSITEERKKTMDFTSPTYDSAIITVVRVTGGEKDSSFFEGIASSFTKTFIQEDRWKLVVEGLKVTILISLCSGVLGTLLGYGTVLARRSGARWPGKLVDVYQALMGGVPLVVVLMVLYYVVFGSVNITGELVSIMAFALSFGATAGSTMWTAVDGIDSIQEETGLALGYTRHEVFSKIIFPQARRQFAPQLAGQFVGLVKETAIVGYIAVQDLTRASDLIRSRTMDAFFPLLSTALIYFLFCQLLAWVLSKLVARLDNANSPREIKEVQQ